MDSKKIVILKKLIVVFVGIFVISFLPGFTPSPDTQACLPNQNQIEFFECEEEDIKGDNLQSSFLIKSVHDNSICLLKNTITLRELFQTRKFFLSSYSPRPPPKVQKFHRNFSHYPIQVLYRSDCNVNIRRPMYMFLSAVMNTSLLLAVMIYSSFRQ